MERVTMEAQGGRKHFRKPEGCEGEVPREEDQGRVIWTKQPMGERDKRCESLPATREELVMITPITWSG